MGDGPETVRDAMVPEPTTLAAGASAQEAGLLPRRQRARCARSSSREDDGRLIGVVTRKTLVREVVAAGLDPSAVSLRDDRRAAATSRSTRGLGLDDAFHFLEEQDLERVPVVEEGGRLVGVLSRAVVQRRLAEDEPPELDPNPGSVALAASL